MNSENLFSSSNDRKENLPLNKNSPIQFTLSYDQYIILQHYLPKKYSLLEYKATKRNPTGSALKFTPDDNQNFSRVSGNFQNTQDAEGRSKRPRPKKVDRFLQNQVPQKGPKRASTDRFALNLDEQLVQCFNILVQLKKHKSSYPFLQPVNPQLDGAYNYHDIIKQPMDLSTIQTNLKNGQYQTASQFHGDINKIWLNSYAYNQKTSPLYKLTIEMQKYYKNLLSNQGIPKKDKIPIKPRTTSKDLKQTKKQSSYEKNDQKQQIKEGDRKSVSGGNQNGFADSDQFLYDK